MYYIYQNTDFFSVIVVSTICKCLPPGRHDEDELVVDQAVVVNVKPHETMACATAG